MSYAIETNNLTKYFIPGSFLDPFKKAQLIKAVDNVNISIEESKIFGLLGPNGAGKTTLIKLLCGLILPDSGGALLAGYDILKESQKIKSIIGLVNGDERSFYWRLTGRQNLEFFASLYDLDKRKARSRIEELANLLQIDNLNRRFMEYSTGEKHRLAIARGLLHNPQIIFMDEPTKSLDPNASFNLRNLIREVLVDKLKRTVFLTTHQTKEAEELADYLAIMDEGKIKTFGTLAELKSRYNQPDITLEQIFIKLTNEKKD
jgi:ABC-2 type transport system ATP-binding protein